jgi:hypothetical protein
VAVVADDVRALAALDGSHAFDPDSEPAPMVVRELRSRYWIGGCGELNFGMKATEATPGQFDRLAYEPREITCGVTGHDHKITVWPVDANIYQQWTSDDDEQ